MNILFIIVRSDNDEGLIYSAIRTWIKDIANNVYIVNKNEKSYGFEHAMLEISPNVIFTDKYLEHNNEEYLMVLRSGEYLDIEFLNDDDKRLIKKEDYIDKSILYYIEAVSKNINSASVFKFGYDYEILNYHSYKSSFLLYSKINATPIPSFPVFAKKIYVSDPRLIQYLVSTLIREPPMKRTLYLSKKIRGLEGLKDIGYDISYEFEPVDVIISYDVIYNWESISNCIFVQGQCGDKFSGDFITYKSGWTISIKKEFRQRRVDISSYFNEVDMLKLRIKELYDTVDLFIIGQMDTPYSSNDPITEGFPEIEDPDNKVRLLNLKYPENVKELNSAWVKDKYFRQYSIYHPEITDFDILFILDLDEIPDMEKLSKELLLYKNYISRLELKLHYYNFKWVKNYNWYHGYIGNTREIRKYGADLIRVKSPVKYPIIPKSGWHISYFMTPENIKKKIESFAHQEFNKHPYTDISHINSAIQLGKDLFDRNYEDMIPADPNYRPKHFEILSSYYH